MDKILCAYSKQTDRTYRWDTTIGCAPLEVTIFKWRVPDPRPSYISVEIFELVEYPRSINYLYQEELLTNLELFSDPIVARFTLKSVDPTVDPTVTFKYKTDLNDDVRETGDIFIPKTLLGSLPPKRLVVVINWEKENVSYHNSTH